MRFEIKLEEGKMIVSKYTKKIEIDNLPKDIYAKIQDFLANVDKRRNSKSIILKGNKDKLQFKSIGDAAEFLVDKSLFKNKRTASQVIYSSIGKDKKIRGTYIAEYAQYYELKNTNRNILVKIDNEEYIFNSIRLAAKWLLEKEDYSSIESARNSIYQKIGKNSKLKGKYQFCYIDQAR